jgi:hypothetical protein
MFAKRRPGRTDCEIHSVAAKWPAERGPSALRVMKRLTGWPLRRAADRRWCLARGEPERKPERERERELEHPVVYCSCVPSTRSSPREIPTGSRPISRGGNALGSPVGSGGGSGVADGPGADRSRGDTDAQDLGGIGPGMGPAFSVRERPRRIMLRAAMMVTRV